MVSSLADATDDNKLRAFGKQIAERFTRPALTGPAGESANDEPLVLTGPVEMVPPPAPIPEQQLTLPKPNLASASVELGTLTGEFKDAMKKWYERRLDNQSLCANPCDMSDFFVRLENTQKRLTAEMAAMSDRDKL